MDGAEQESSEFKTLATMANAVSLATSKYMSAVVHAMADNEVIKGHIDDGIMPYVYIAGLLSFAGRDINVGTVSSVVSAMGEVPDNDLIDALLNAGIRSHAIYIYAYFFLLASGKLATVDTMTSIVEALGFKSEKTTAAQMIELCKKAVSER